MSLNLEVVRQDDGPAIYQTPTLLFCLLSVFKRIKVQIVMFINRVEDIVTWVLKGGICHFAKWKIPPFNTQVSTFNGNIDKKAHQKRNFI